MSDDRWSWLAAGAASGGTVAGVLVGGGVGLLGARGLGLEESVADYGAPFFVTVASACVLGLAGCHVALRLMGDSRATATVLVLAVLLPGSALSLDPIGQALAGALDWSFGLMVTIGVVSYVSCVVLSPVVARFIAGFLPAHGGSTPAWPASPAGGRSAAR